MKKVTIATRGSQLALWQAEHIKSRLMAQYEGLEVELLILKTKGDIILDVPLAKVGGKGLFVKEIEEALLAGTADLAVHSMKDVPMVLPEGLTLGAVPEREICTDLFLPKSTPPSKNCLRARSSAPAPCAASRRRWPCAPTSKWPCFAATWRPACAR